MSDPAVLNTILKPIYGAKEEAVSGLCLHCVHGNKLASIDHLATNPLLTGHLSAWRHRKEAGSSSELHRQSHTYIIFFLCHYVNTCCSFFSSLHQPNSKVKWVIETVSQWPFSCLLSNQINTCTFPFIWSDTQHLRSLASRLWLALISQWTSLCHITIFSAT